MNATNPVEAVQTRTMTSTTSALKRSLEEAMRHPAPRGEMTGYALPLPKLLTEADRLTGELDDCDHGELERLTEAAKGLILPARVLRVA